MYNQVNFVHHIILLWKGIDNRALKNSVNHVHIAFLFSVVVQAILWKFNGFRIFHSRIKCNLVNSVIISGFVKILVKFS